MSKVTKGKAGVQRQGKTTSGFARREKEEVGKAMRVLEGEGNERVDLDKWEGKSGGGWVSKSIQNTGGKEG